MNLLSCFELGIVDTLREKPGQTATELGEAVGAKRDAVEQLLQLMVKESFISYDDDSDDMGLFRARVDELQERAAAAGRGRMEITVMLARLDTLDRYAEAGADRVLVLLPTGEERTYLKEIAAGASRFV